MEIRYVFSRMTKLIIFIFSACVLNISTSDNLYESCPNSGHDKKFCEIVNLVFRERETRLPQDPIYYVSQFEANLKTFSSLCAERDTEGILLDFLNYWDPDVPFSYYMKRLNIIAFGCVRETVENPHEKCKYKDNFICRYGNLSELESFGLAHDYIMRRVNVKRYNHYKVNRMEIDPQLGTELFLLAEDDLCKEGAKIKNVEMYDIKSIGDVGVGTLKVMEESLYLKNPGVMAIGCITPSLECARGKIACKFRIASDSDTKPAHSSDTQPADSDSEMDINEENNAKELTSALLIVPYLLNIFL